MPSGDYKDRARKRAKERSSGFWWKLVVGDNSIRLLPTPESDTTPSVWMEYGVHRDVGRLKKTVRCGKVPNSDKGRCWLCDKKIPVLRDSGKEARASALEPQIMTLLQVAIPGEDGVLEGPRGWNPSKKVGDRILGSVLGSKKTEYVDAKKGHCINITRHGTGKNDTTYDWDLPDEEATPIPADMLKKLKAFSELKEIPQYSEAAQKAAFEGVELEEGRGASKDEDDPKPRKPKKPPVEEDEDEEEDDADSEEEEDADEDAEEEDPEPVKPKAKKKPAPEPEPEEEEESEDEDEDEEEEEEPEPPTKPVKKKKPAPEPEPEEEDEEEDADEDEEEEAAEDEDEEEEAPPPPKRKLPVPINKKKK